jgi:hypothetical protein
MFAPANRLRIHWRALVALGLALLVAACKNGGGPTY